MRDFPEATPCLAKTVGAAQMAAMSPPPDSWLRSKSPTSEDSPMALEPPSPPGSTTTSNLSEATWASEVSGRICTSREHFTASPPFKPATVTLIYHIVDISIEQSDLMERLRALTPALLRTSAAMMNSISSAPGAKITSALFDILVNLEKCLEI